MKRIAVVTSTRADYGILKPLIQALEKADWAQLQLLVTGSHLLESQGSTLHEIEAEGVPVAAAVPIFCEGDTTALHAARAFGRAAEQMAPVLDQLKPDALVVLGDRFEILAVAAAAVLLHIPIIHLHGGEQTFGALDNRFRHAISRLADWHLTATEQARETLMRMGLPSERVYHVGSLGVWNVLNQPRLSREALQVHSPIALKAPLLLITFHPETDTGKTPQAQVEALIKALEAFPDTTQIITYANVDEGGEVINALWRAYAARHGDRVWLTPSLGQLRYHSLMALSDAVIGNSSSGILEAPSFGVPTVNIGARQAGRERAVTVVDVPAESSMIIAAIERVLTQGKMDSAQNPYACADTLGKTLKIIREKVAP